MATRSELRAELMQELVEALERDPEKSVSDVASELRRDLVDAYEASHRSSGWSTTVGTLKRILRHVPDTYEVMLENADVEDIEIATLHVQRMYPPTQDSPGLLVLSSGQTVSTEYGYHDRMDEDHEVGTTLHWIERRDRWQS